MATSSLYGTSSESTGLYGIGAASGGTYFEWFIFQDSATAPATPTGGSWSFTTNTGTAPSGWLNAPPASPVNQIWVSIAIVDSRNTSALVWSAPGLMTGSGLPILTGSDVPSSGTGLNGQLYVNTATTPQSMYLKESGTWVQITGSTLYATAGANTNITSLTGITGGISSATYLQLNTAGDGALASGKLQWDTTWNGPQIGMGGGNVNLQIGQETLIYVYNNTGSTLTDGQVVYATGSQGQRLTVSLAQANADATSATILGVVTEPIANNSSGFVTTQGMVNGLNTNGFADGAVIYLSPTTPGAWTTTKPQAPQHLVQVGYVIKGGSGGAGSIYIHPQNGYELNELHDVRITSVANKNLLQYDSAYPAWVNIAGPNGSIVGTTDTQTLTNKTISGSSNTLTDIPNSALVNDSVNVNGVDLTLGAVQLLGADWILPSYTGNAGKVLALNPSASDVQWISAGGVGTVTSIDVSGGTTGLTTTGGPVTAAGTITFGGILNVENGGTGVTTSTGTGSVVLSISPSLVTPALGTPASGNFSTGTFTWPTFNQNTTGNAATATTATNVSGGSASVTTLTASSTVTLDGGTANGVAYLNGSKVVTTGSALTFNGTTFATTAIGSFTGGVGIAGVGNPSSGASVEITYGAAGFTGVGRIMSYDRTGAARTPLAFDGSYQQWLISNTEGMRLTSTGLGIGTSSPTNALSVSGNANITGNTTLGDATTDTVTVNGYMGVGGAGSTSNGLSVVSSALTGAGQIGFLSSITATSAATNNARAIYGKVSTAAAAFTVGNVYNIFSDDVTKGAGSTVTNQYGLYIADQTQGTNNYGITSAVSSGSNKWNIYASGTAANYFAGNVGIGTSSPASLLDVASSSTDVVFSLTATGVQRWQLKTERSTGKFLVYNQTGASTPITLTTSGDLGIGTSSPTQKLHLSGSVGANIYGRWSNGSQELYAGISSASTIVLGSLSNDPVLFYANSSERMRLDAPGNLGLGVTPSAWGFGGNLELPATNNISFQGSGNLLFNAYYSVASSGYVYKTSNNAARYQGTNGGQHQWFTAPSGTAGTAISFTQAMTLDSSGNLGIGTTSVGSRLHIQSATPVFTIQDTTSAAGGVGGTINFIGYTSGTSGSNVEAQIKGVKSSANAAGELQFFTSDSAGTSTQRAMIDGTGNLLVATTTASTTDTGNGTVLSSIGGYIISRRVSGATQTHLQFANGGATVGNISSSTTATTYNTSSDYRLKNITGPISNSGAYIDSLKPVEGTWKSDGSVFVGLLAHEAQEVSRTPVASGVKDGEEMQTMSYSSSEMIANMIAELKSLRARVAALESN